MFLNKNSKLNYLFGDFSTIYFAIDSEQSSLPKKYRFMIMIWINGFEPVLEPETNRFFRVNHPIPEPILPDFFG